MPRSYNLGRRAEPKADTRARIVAAAMAIYRDRGLAAASNLAIARAADVAPATVRNHFPDPGDLARAVFDGLLEELRVPNSAIFDGPGSAGACHAARRGAGRLLRTERVVVAGVRTGAGTDQRMGRRGRPVLRRHRTADAGRAWRAVRRRAVGGGRRLGDRAADVLRLPGPGPLIRGSRPAQSRAVPSMARAAQRSPGRSGVSAATSPGTALRVWPMRAQLRCIVTWPTSAAPISIELAHAEAESL